MGSSHESLYTMAKDQVDILPKMILLNKYTY